MKNLRLRVKSDGNVCVSAPYGVSKTVIEEFVRSRADWISEQQKKLSEIVPQTPAELSDGSVITLLLMFMAKQCRKICTEAVQFYLERSGYKGSSVNLDFKYLKSRWGSYNRQKNLITFNLALCKLPEKYISYVAAHEVTHIFIHNHSDDFYKFGETIFKDFLKTDRELNRIRIGGLFS